ncbi:hypothetical protein HRbin07_00291 [bacterium HR07]|uniref:Hypothetical conserved protein n=2 Tax=Candidatus Bipolaricaulota TaxID=67810 RepID=H5SKE0_9BACT|nr:hypothetical conserved protein [uncultured Acetothermia bacterium]BAL56626.1 hypothetical conserved protein [uncultured Acetothermia bacterium]BAL59295.1 hypothetical conserved protein [Candidatus Acetothermum autotrophicum]GBC76095.1 hypothetical protein HRbin07_00291 [bacterium HR07]
MKEIQRVVIDPNICHGKPTIRGTRIMVSNILSLIRGGYTIPQILEYYPELTEEDVKAAIDYAAAVIEEETILTGTP